jgi:NADH-quinone oxidoreductase subunit C
MAPEEILAALAATGAEARAADHARRGTHVDAVVPAGSLLAAAEALAGRAFLIEDVTAVDAAPQLMVVHHFHHVDGGCRVTLRVLTDRENPEVPSIQGVFPGANWHERETHDFYGVVFAGHPDLSPLILPEDSGHLRPLRKAEKGLKALGDVIPEFGPPPGEPAEQEAKPRAKKPKTPAPEGEA